MSEIKVELLGFFGNDRQIAESAWTSSMTKSKKDGRTDVDVERVIIQMAAEGHGTPFESVIFKFWIKLPTSTDRQHVTHRIASHNGMSARYRTMPEEWFPIPQDVLDILNRFTVLGDIPKGAPYGEYIKGAYDDIFRQAFDLYKSTLKYLREVEAMGQLTNPEYKRCREILRNMIPVGNMTERTTIMNLRSFANYQRQRNSEHAQKEIREIAQQMLRLVQEANICPIALRELEKNGWRI